MLRQFLPSIVLLLLYSTPIHAHKMLLSCTLKADRVLVEVFYDDDTPAQEAEVRLGADEQNVIASGKTDERGNWFCAIPAAGTYQVWATSTGHKAKGEIVVPASGSQAKANHSPSSEPTREEQTRVPWDRLAIGLGIVTGLLLVWYFTRRLPLPSRDR
jgi:hypothetical protein